MPTARVLKPPRITTKEGYGAHAGETIRGNLGRSTTGQFTRVGGPSSDAPPRFGKRPKQPKAARAGKKPAKPKLTDAQRQQARDEKKRASDLARATDRAENRQTILARMNIAPDGQAALGDLADGEQPRDPSAIERGGFVQAGLVERAQDGSYRMTASGRAAMAAAAAGDAGRAGAIISAARDRTGARTERTNAAATKRQAAQARRDQVAARRAKRAKQQKSSSEQDATVKSFTVYKDHTGAHRWLARTTTAYRDRDQEIISSDALDQDSQRMTATKSFGPLRYWHVGAPDPLDVQAPWGPGLDIGDCDYSTLIGRTRVESGTFRDRRVAQTIAQQAERYELSPGFFHPLDQPDSGGIYHAIRTFERSIVPVKYGRAANLFTGLAVKEHRMDIAEMEKRFKAAIDDLGLTKDQALAFGQQLVQTEKDAAAQGIAFKSDDSEPDYPDVVINGVTYKAAPPAAAAPMDAEDDPALGGDSGVDEAAEGEPPMDGQDMSGDYLGDMSWDEFAAKLGELLAPVLKMQDMMKAMGDMHGELKTMYGGVAQKDDSRAAELIALKAQMSDLASKIAQIEGDQPSVILPDEVEAALKSAGPAKPATPENPAKQEALSDPNRPLAWLGMQTFPELYNQNGDAS